MSLMENIIHSTAVIGSNVIMGTGNYIGPYCVFSGHIEIGNDNKFLSHVCAGQPPQHRGFDLVPERIEKNGVIRIGSRNVFHEFVTIHQPFHKLTTIGSDCFLMAYVHVPHDCIIEDLVTIANNAQIGGHSILMKGCNIGLSTCIHQFSVIGSYSMIGMGSVVVKNVLPYNLYTGAGPKRLGVNKVGMKRLGFDTSKVERVQEWSTKYLSGNIEAQIDDDVFSEVVRFNSIINKLSEPTNT